MELTRWDIVLWISGYVGNICLMAVLLAKRRYRAFPWFTLFLANELVQDPLLALIARYGAAKYYFYTYWTLDVLDSLLLLFVIFELAKSVMRAIDENQGVFQSLEMQWLVAALLLVGMACWIFLPGVPHPMTLKHTIPILMVNLAFKAATTSSVIMCGLACYFFRAIFLYGVRFRVHAAAIAYGLTAYVLTRMLVYVSVLNTGSRYLWDLLSRWSKPLYILVLLVWSLMLWLDEPKRKISVNRWFSRNLPARRWLLVLLIGVVCLAGWQVWLTVRLLDQDRNLEQQNARERLGEVADLTVAQLSGSLGDWGLGLHELNALPPSSSLAARIPKEATLILIHQEGIEVFPPRTLLFVPTTASLSAQIEREFDRAGDLELREQQYDQAIATLQPLTLKGSTRAEAILRMARIENKQGHSDSALETYKTLEREASLNAEETSYGLLAISARCGILAQLGRRPELVQEAKQMQTGLVEGRWKLSPEAFDYYWSELERFGLQPGSPPQASVEFAILVNNLYGRWQSARSQSPNSSGRELEADGAILVWNATPDRMSALLTPPGWLSSGLRLTRDSGEVRWKLLAPGATGSTGLVVTRSLADARLQGRLEFTNQQGISRTGVRRRTLLIAGATLMLVAILASGYVVQRAISRELQVAQLQSDFVGAVSHEFRSPLTTLRSITELLAQNRLTDESSRQQSYVYLERETTRLHRLVEDLLDFGRMESGRQQFRVAPHDAFQLVRRTLGEFAEQAAANGFRVESEFPSGNGYSSARIQVDEEALRRAVRNLLDNAMKYSPECRTIWVGSSVEGNKVYISVRDQGMGIGTAEQQAIFQKFVRGDAAKEAGIKGTGIGLAMVRQIVEAMHGEVRLKSEIGVGSTFTLVLPLAET
jgi:signal transduction histidine kinase